jgi:hypothetical protein
MHVHHYQDEGLTVVRGRIGYQRLGEPERFAGPGETVVFSPGQSHRFWNAGDDEVVIATAGPAMPQSFAAALVQLYRVMDERGTRPLTMLLQMSVVDPIFDTHLADVPRAAQRILAFVLAPAARLAGYRNYYPEYALHPPLSSDAQRAAADSLVSC